MGILHELLINVTFLPTLSDLSYRRTDLPYDEYRGI
jgi:hypothetical protein